MRVLLEARSTSRVLSKRTDRFAGDGTWFAPLAGAAEEDGGSLYLPITPSWASKRTAREVRVTLARSRSRAGALLTYCWHPPDLSGRQWLIPLTVADHWSRTPDLSRC